MIYFKRLCKDEPAFLPDFGYFDETGEVPGVQLYNCYADFYEIDEHAVVPVEELKDLACAFYCKKEVGDYVYFSITHDDICKFIRMLEEIDKVDEEQRKALNEFADRRWAIMKKAVNLPNLPSHEATKD